MSHCKYLTTYLNAALCCSPSCRSPQSFHSSSVLNTCFRPSPWSLTSTIPLFTLHSQMMILLSMPQRTFKRKTSTCPHPPVHPLPTPRPCSLLLSNPGRCTGLAPVLDRQLHCLLDPMSSDPLRNSAPSPGASLFNLSTESFPLA